MGKLSISGRYMVSYIISHEASKLLIGQGWYLKSGNLPQISRPRALRARMHALSKCIASHPLRYLQAPTRPHRASVQRARDTISRPDLWQHIGQREPSTATSSSILGT